MLLILSLWKSEQKSLSVYKWEKTLTFAFSTRLLNSTHVLFKEEKSGKSAAPSL